MRGVRDILPGEVTEIWMKRRGEKATPLTEEHTQRGQQVPVLPATVLRPERGVGWSPGR